MRDFFLPARVVGGGSGTKFSLHAKSGPKSAFWGSLGEFCTGWACQGRLLGEFCTGWAADPGGGESFVPEAAQHRSCWGNFFPVVPADLSLRRCGTAGAQLKPRPLHMWIGYKHPDSLLTYPPSHNLSGSLQPILVGALKPVTHSSMIGGAADDLRARGDGDFAPDEAVLQDCHWNVGTSR